MPYRIVDEGEGLYISLFGEVPFDELRRANEAAWEHPRFERHRYQIWDNRQVTRLGLAPDQAVALARMDSVAFRLTRSIRTAIVADQAALLPVLETYVANVDPAVVPAAIFPDAASARKWVTEY